jgi:hypothetical protein
MKKTILVTLIFSISIAHAQDSLSVTDGFQVKPEFTGRKIAATSAIGGMLVMSLIWSYDTWWRDAGRPFHFKTENWLDGYFRGIDKVGHFYTSYFYFNTFRNLMLWGGYEHATANWWAAGATAFFGDGVTKDYGFDYQDVLFNFSGLGYGLLQTKVPFLRNFNFKWTYAPNEGYRFPVRFTDNYDAHTYWLTCDVNNLLPSSLEPYWPDWLNLAVGMGVDDKWTKREFVIGFDISIVSIFQPTNEDWLLAQKTLDLFHYPAPAMKFTEDKAPRYYFFHRN